MESISLLWEGSQFVYHSLALVNREIVLELLKEEGIDISLKLYEKHTFSAGADPVRFPALERLFIGNGTEYDFHLRHRWPPDFSGGQGKDLIIMQPWEYGILPKDWIRPLQNDVDEIWVNSRHEWKTFTDSGIPEEKLFLVPLGVNMDLFHPDAAPFELKTGKKFKFLFVGGTIWRKGIDALLTAYKHAFTGRDDVTLIIKDIGSQSFYKGMNAEKEIRAFIADKNNPEIVYLPDELSDRDIAGLYTAADCLVHPYRAEGFGLPVLEAMACSLPVILTEGGACDDFTGRDTVYYIRAQKAGINLNDIELLRTGWLLNPDPGHLAELMSNAVSDPSAVKRKGAKAGEYVRKNWTWVHSSKAIAERLRDKKRGTSIKQKGNMMEDSAARTDRLIKTVNEYFQAGRFAEAVPVYKELLTLYPDNTEIGLQLGITLFNAGDLGEAESVLSGILQKVPDNSKVHNNLGCIFFSKSEFEKSEEHFIKAIEFDRANIEAKRNLLTAYLSMKKFDKVIEVSESILESNPDDVDTLFALGNSSYQLGEYAIAADIYKRILIVNPDNEDARINLETVENVIKKSGQ